ncbi:hypothetical protein [Emergencia sp. 1XD21-10]|uniref:hypothetical protein n=1 Tax=Emergencia sp. 1XD21-10 TaxID=2304569 RepID=UPI001379ADA7|nr:hypothetical protein [Emergencia sp. 1XD21-10]NCE97592.1 hypothetical protein [Emergencia sp. 1XD21-10]
MNKRFKMYALVWAIMFIVFQVICFVTPTEVAGMNKCGGAFWAGYVFINLAFVGQLVCAYIALKAENLQKLFYNLSLINVSYTGLVLMLICGGAAMIVPNIPNWVGIIICLLILAFTATSVIKAKAAVDIVDRLDDKLKTQTFFMQSLRADAETLMTQARSAESKTACKQVYEAVRYADPMSYEALEGLDGQITLKFAELKEAVASEADLAENVQQLAKEVVVLVQERGKKAKLVK